VGFKGKMACVPPVCMGLLKVQFHSKKGMVIDPTMVWKGECGRKMAISHVEKHLKMFFGFSSRNVGQILLDGFLGDSTREVNKKKAPSFFWGPGPCLGPGENYPKICYGAIFSSMKSGSPPKKNKCQYFSWWQLMSWSGVWTLHVHSQQPVAAPVVTVLNARLMAMLWPSMITIFNWHPVDPFEASAKKMVTNCRIITRIHWWVVYYFLEKKDVAGKQGLSLTCTPKVSWSFIRLVYLPPNLPYKSTTVNMM